MANTDTPFGLRPVRHKSGAPYNGSFNAYYVPSTYATALFVGDPVVRVNTGSNAAAFNTPGGDFPIGTLPIVAKATAGDGNAITGVIVGFGPDPDGLGRIHNPASTERLVYVVDDPDMVFEAQMDGTLTATMVGLNAVLIYTTAGSTTTGRSGAEVDTGTTTAPSADASNQLTIRRMVNRVDNEMGLNAKVEVTINNHTEAHASLGI